MAETAKKPAAKAKAKAPALKKSTATGKQIKVTQMGSPIGRIEKQAATLRGLGLGKRHRSKVLADTPEVRGMIEVVKHLVVVEDAA